MGEAHSLSQDDVAAIIGRLALNHELELKRLRAVFDVQVRQLQAEVESLRTQLRGQVAKT